MHTYKKMFAWIDCEYRNSRKCCQTTLFFRIQSYSVSSPQSYWNSFFCVSNVEYRLAYRYLYPKIILYLSFQQKISTSQQTTYWHVWIKTQLHSVVQFHTNHHGHPVLRRKFSEFLVCGKIGSVLRISMPSKYNQLAINIGWTSVSVLKLINFWMLLFAYNVFRIDISRNKWEAKKANSFQIPFVSIHQNGNFDLFFFEAIQHRLKVSANGVN